MRLRENRRKFYSPASSSSKCVSRWIKKPVYRGRFQPFTNCVLPDLCQVILSVTLSFVCEPVLRFLCFFFYLLHNTSHFECSRGRILRHNLWIVELSVSLLQVVNCWYTQLYVTSDVAVLCSFTRGGGCVGAALGWFFRIRRTRDATVRERGSLFVAVGWVRGGLQRLQLLAPWEVKFSV